MKSPESYEFVQKHSVQGNGQFVGHPDQLSNPTVGFSSESGKKPAALGNGEEESPTSAVPKMEQIVSVLKHLAHESAEACGQGEPYVLDRGIQVTAVERFGGTVRLTIDLPLERNGPLDEPPPGPEEWAWDRLVPDSAGIPFSIVVMGRFSSGKRRTGKVLLGRRATSEEVGDSGFPFDLPRWNDSSRKTPLQIAGQPFVLLVILARERRFPNPEGEGAGYLTPELLAERLNKTMGAHVPRERIKCVIYDLREKLAAIYRFLFGVTEEEAKEEARRIIETSESLSYRLAIRPDLIDIRRVR